MSFTVTGRVRSKWTSPRFARLSVELPPEGGRAKSIDLRTFSDFAGHVAELREGQTVVVEFSIDRERLTSKDRAPVIVDGREAWTTVLTIRGLTSVEGAREPAKVAPASAVEASDDIPF